MIKQEVQDALNEQINAELYSSYLYLSMSACFESKGFSGVANWMRIQTDEERMHAMKFYDFVNSRGGKVTLKAIDAPPAEWDTPLAAFEGVYTHERKVTELINGLLGVAKEHDDHATESFLKWFVDEQVQEERTADEIVQQLKLMADFKPGLIMLDRELGQRAPAPVVPAVA
ncbi:MAG: ferritin [Armatimonadetes bacterium CG2_30_59_28]|nr:ferritin [Armatimonadota bacterium]OIO89337.1 MAG: ferritin [Armatimonadetes bacterium CG2_30_59_28]PIU66490.1 MAG: ferritin [Armatimonadetes bacterium CG07_land_8_20_14_0_80_59_28]PIX42272.1 MAG: ferritin [Armatimonadetes bacterium CG_4_8_14_3_um_filter_58_9]PIY44033.1 MAG: ferritin [Armatimonadetes bacterium CG_4_10_14_3_um_filter_59_10]PJB66320.1 MAG: ferritin [Armatimonadetes bacterium CG_4_9_14_3_um_filter_58_7]